MVDYTYRWERRSSAGPKPIFRDGDHLIQCCMEYFKHVDNDPWFEEKVGFYEGTACHTDLRKTIPYTVTGLCVFLDITMKTWCEYRKREEYAEAVELIDNIIRTQKLSGGMAGFFNANLVARDLNLMERTEIVGEVKHEHGVSEQVSLFTDMISGLVKRIEDENSGG